MAGKGNGPCFYGSPVAGPDSGYQNDYRYNGVNPYANGNVNAVGPWQRIAYTGSQVGPGNCAPGMGGLASRR